MILHADADAFFAAVEQRDDPRLLGRPTLVGTWVVMAASYEARARGVKSAMGTARALRLCPNAAVVEPHFSAYTEASRALFEVFRLMAPKVEGLSLEEAFLDVRGLETIFGPVPEIGAELRRVARERVDLPVTVGGGSTKLIAKMASRAAKPDGLLVVAPGDELDFLHPMPAERLWGIGPKTAAKLRRRGIATVGEVAEIEEAALISILGPAAGRQLHRLANNLDPRPVRAGRSRRSVGSQSALDRPPGSPGDIDRVLVALCDRVARRVRKAGRAGRTIVLRLRFADYSRATRSRTLPFATSSTRRILIETRALLAASMPMIERRGLTLVGVTLSNLDHRRAGAQLELPFGGRRQDALDIALDEIRERFGTAAITRAALIGRGHRLSPSLYG